MNLQRSRFEAPGGFSANRPDLAHMPELAVGPILVVPASRLLRAEDGREHVVEPLVMQVLLALAEAEGATLSRDDLVAMCWGRRIVGDDAINRAISHLRRDLSHIAGDRVRVETIAKVGYRLAIGSGEPQSAIESHVEPQIESKGVSPDTKRGGWRRAAMVLGTVASAALLGSAIVARPGNSELALAIAPMSTGGDDRGAGKFAGDLSTDIARLTGSMTDLTLIEPGTGSADLVLNVSLDRPAKGAGHAAFLRLVDKPSGAVVWSREFTGPTLALVRERAAYGTTGVLRCGLHRSSGDLGDPVSKRLYLAACEAVDAEDWPRAHSFAKQIAERRPDSAASWACLAMVTAIIGNNDPAVRDAAAREAMRLARKALAIDPNSGLAHQAIGMASDVGGGDSFASFEEGVRRDPEHSGLLSHYAQALASMGYVQEAVEPGVRANALEPNNYWMAQGAMFRLLGAGRLDEARRLATHIERIWGDDFDTNYSRQALRFYDPDPARALALFDRSPPGNPLVAQRWRLELLWRLDPGRADWAAFDRNAAEAYAANPDSAWLMAASAIRMGDEKRAFDWLSRARLGTELWPLAPLFWPDAAPLRKDRRFIEKMTEVGLVDRWRQRGRWPDFCNEPGLDYQCPREARIAGLSPR